MISTAKEFFELRTSSERDNYTRAAADSASEDVWLEVIENYPEMKKWVIHNKTVPLSILRVLAIDDNPRIRFAVAMKRKIDIEIQKKLANDTDDSVRLAIARNAKADLEIIRQLSNDKTPNIAEEARKRLSS